ncbi:sushi domain-containing protein 1 isoform X2 [Engraulis encrasicolus]|uniref:sushi domain-containing protein 1 isoform X2 n=1 Tax=Engraulis encrasicolus TaxID=184585 RepID=UPI002FD42241
MTMLTGTVMISAVTFLLHGMPNLLKDPGVAANVFDVCTTCHPNATCEMKTDGSGGYACNCNYGFVGNGRTHCEDKDECQIGANFICGDHTMCHNTHGSFFCTCLSGYKPTNNMAVFIPNDGSYCQDIDECEIQGVCGVGGQCRNTDGDFECECQVGYRVKGGTVPFHPHRTKAFCQAVDCGPPPPVHHAILLSRHPATVYGSVVSYGCQPGFLYREGDNSSLCTEQGTWRGPSLTCEEVTCGEPPTFPHASVIMWDRNTRMGAEVHYGCEGGFRLVGPSSITVCTAAGVWSTLSLHCEEIACGQPPAVPHSHMSWDGGTVIGSSVAYQCDKGYHRVGNGNSSICTEKGLWSEVSFTCEVVTCGNPPMLPHAGQVWNGSTTVGSTVLYYCNGSFHYVAGTNISECTTNGSWTQPTLTCKEIDCGTPPALPHSHMLWLEGSHMGAEVFYECDVGYYNEGLGNVSICTVDSIWSSPYTVCQEISCGSPPAVPHTRTLWDKSTRFGAKTVYECDTGYRNVGLGNTSVCTTNRLWSGPLVICQARCGHVPEVAHAEVLWDNASVAVHRCAEGYYTYGGVNMSTCGADGRWRPATLRCREIRDGLSHLEVYDERCLRWVTDGKREDYKVLIVGIRDYQKSFVDRRFNTFSFSTKRPEVCLKLLPATNYTVNITAVLANSSAVVTANTTVSVTPEPEITFRDVEGPQPTLWLHRSVHTLDPICQYEVFVVPAEGSSIVFDCSPTRTPPRFSGEGSSSSSNCHGEYVAAQFPLRDVGRELSFTIGDGQHYAGYFNAPLKNGQDYFIILKTACQWGESRKHSCVLWAKTRGISYRMRTSSLVAAGTIAFFGFGILIGYLYNRYFKN